MRELRHCINCRETLLVDTNLLEPDTAPSPGDVAVCIYCGHIMAYTDSLDFRELTEEEMLKVAGDPEILKAQKAVRYWERHG